MSSTMTAAAAQNDAVRGPLGLSCNTLPGGIDFLWFSGCAVVDSGSKEFLLNYFKQCTYYKESTWEVVMTNDQ
jgi:hypothetical protein